MLLTVVKKIADLFCYIELEQKPVTYIQDDGLIKYKIRCMIVMHGPKPIRASTILQYHKALIHYEAIFFRLV